MSGKIPPEHPAAKSLEHAFRSLGAEKARVRRHDRSGRAWRIAVATLAPVLAVAAVATGTKVFTGDGGTVPADRGGTPDPEGRGRLTPSGRQLALAVSPSPGGGAPWGMRVYRSATGRTCLAVGRVVHGKLGVVEAGQFRELPTAYPGQCGTLKKDHYMAGRQGVPGGYDVLYGIVDRTVHRLHLMRAATGRTWEVAIADDGTFLVARHGKRAFFHQMLVLDGTTGRRTIPLDPA